MIRLRDLGRNRDGASTVEMALVLPFLVSFIYGIFVVGTMFQANAGMQHALGEGARLANLYPAPDDTAILAKMNAALFKPLGGTFSPSVSSGTNSCNPTTGATNYKTLTVTYSMPINFLFYSRPDLTMTRCKVVYTAS